MSILTLRSCIQDPSDLFMDLRQFGYITDEAAAFEHIKNLFNRRVILEKDKVEELLTKKIKDICDENEQFKKDVEWFTNFITGQQLVVEEQAKTIDELQNRINNFEISDKRQFNNLNEQYHKIKELEEQVQQYKVRESQIKEKALAEKSVKKSSILAMSPIFSEGIPLVPIAQVSIIDRRSNEEKCAPLLPLKQREALLAFIKK